MKFHAGGHRDAILWCPVAPRAELQIDDAVQDANIQGVGIPAVAVVREWPDGRCETEGPLEPWLLLKEHREAERLFL